MPEDGKQVGGTFSWPGAGSGSWHTASPKMKGMWQDPVFGYFESHGKMEFQANEQYDLSPTEKSAVMQRYKIKELLKREFLRRDFHPVTKKYHHGVIMDPALFRWFAADNRRMETFRLTPKTILVALGITLVPLFAIGFYAAIDTVGWSIAVVGVKQDRHMRLGNLLWWDRINGRSATVSGTGTLFGQGNTNDSGWSPHNMS